LDSISAKYEKSHGQMVRVRIGEPVYDLFGGSLEDIIIDAAEKEFLTRPRIYIAAALLAVVIVSILLFAKTTTAYQTVNGSRRKQYPRLKQTTLLAVIAPHIYPQIPIRSSCGLCAANYKSVSILQQELFIHNLSNRRNTQKAICANRPC